MNKALLVLPGSVILVWNNRRRICLPKWAGIVRAGYRCEVVGVKGQGVFCVRKESEGKIQSIERALL